VSALLQFRRALAHMDTDFPFSPAFGIADSRETCVASAQDVFLRLLLQTPESDGVVPFETFATTALQKNEQLDLIKLKELIQVFRPDRDGSLTLLDFARSVDAVYKKLRLLRASIHNSSKIDRALENIINIMFYAVTTVVILAALGFNPLSLFLSLSSIILAFAFMIGSASSKYFDGLLFILVQRPYDIGDRINVSNSESEANGSGSQGWIVENISLFTTSFVLAASNERATISNGSLAKSRIINGARSPKARLFFLLKFGVEIPYEKIEIFRSVVDKFVKARPREWMALDSFRATRVEADLGFIEYVSYATPELLIVVLCKLAD
jgi:small-conductance mechanosensitive channel